MKKIVTLFFILAFSLNSFSQTTEKGNPKIYPNPAQSQGVVTVLFDNPLIIKEATLISTHGKPLVWASSPTNNLILPKLSKGVYFLRLTTVDKKVVSKKIVVL